MLANYNPKVKTNAGVSEDSGIAGWLARILHNTSRNAVVPCLSQIALLMTAGLLKGNVSIGGKARQYLPRHIAVQVPSWIIKVIKPDILSFPSITLHHCKSCHRLGSDPASLQSITSSPCATSLIRHGLPNGHCTHALWTSKRLTTLFSMTSSGPACATLGSGIACLQPFSPFMPAAPCR